jgi:hypothetical protein
MMTYEQAGFFIIGMTAAAAVFVVVCLYQDWKERRVEDLVDLTDPTIRDIARFADFLGIKLDLSVRERWPTPEVVDAMLPVVGAARSWRYSHENKTDDEEFAAQTLLRYLHLLDVVQGGFDCPVEGCWKPMEHTHDDDQED